MGSGHQAVQAEAGPCIPGMRTAGVWPRGMQVVGERGRQQRRLLVLALPPHLLRLGEGRCSGCPSAWWETQESSRCSRLRAAGSALAGLASSVAGGMCSKILAGRRAGRGAGTGAGASSSVAGEGRLVGEGKSRLPGKSSAKRLLSPGAGSDRLPRGLKSESGELQAWHSKQELWVWLGQGCSAVHSLTNLRTWLWATGAHLASWHTSRLSKLLRCWRSDCRSTDVRKLHSGEASCSDRAGTSPLVVQN